MRGDGLLDAIELDEYSPLFKASFVDLRGHSARKKTTASGLDRWPSQLSIFHHRGWVGDRAVGRYPIGFRHVFILLLGG
jgi:hypothetical protein